MTRRSLAYTTATVVAALAIAACAATPRPDGYDAAFREAERNLKSRSNSAYYRLLERKLSNHIRRSARRCRFDESHDTRATTLLYRLDASGSVVEAIGHPGGAFSECMVASMSGYAVPPPPKPDFWLRVFIPGCPLGGGMSECPWLF